VVHKLATEILGFAGLGAWSKEQPSHPAELAKRRQRLAVEHRELKSANVEFFRLYGAASRDAE
jgi:hypothetical protein